MKRLGYLVLVLATASRLPGQPSPPAQTTLPHDAVVRIFREWRQANDCGNLLLHLVNDDENTNLFSLVQIESASGGEGTINILKPEDLALPIAKVMYKVMRLPAGTRSGTPDDNGAFSYSPYYTPIGTKEYAVVDTRTQNIRGMPVDMLKADVLDTFPTTMIIPDSWLSPMANLLADMKAKSLKEIKPEDLLTTAPQAGSLGFLFAAVKFANEDPALFAKAFPALLPKCDEISTAILMRMLFTGRKTPGNGANTVPSVQGTPDSDLAYFIAPLKEATQNATSLEAVRNIISGMDACASNNSLPRTKLDEIITILKGKEKKNDSAWVETNFLIDQLSSAPP